MVSEEHPDQELIIEKKEALNVAWQKLKLNAEQREKGLDANHEIQQFNR